MRTWTRRAILGTAAGLVGSIAGCARPTGGVIDGWPLWRRDPARTGYNPEASGPTAGRGGWSVQVGDAAGPAIATGNAVYIGGDGVTAIDGRTGRLRWRHPLFHAAREAPAAAGGRVYAVGRSALLTFRADGGQQWWFETNNIWRFHAPVVANGRVYVAMTKVKYSTSFDARVVTYDLHGDLRWQSPVGSNVLPPFAVAVEGDRVFAGRDRVYALDARTGRRDWTFDDPAVAAFGNPVVADDTVYTPATWRSDGVPAGALYALNRTDGGERWRVRTGLSPTPPAVTTDGIYLAAGRAIGLNLDGTRRWEYGGNQFVTASPSVAEETVYFPGIDGRVVAVDAADGEPRWTRSTPGSILYTPAVVQDRLYVSSADGYLTAFSG